MSVDIDWDKVTKGPDGEALADKIRDFIHDKFQQITLPRFIKAVHVHSFDFGSACPEIEIKDISDPLPDFYEDDDENEDAEETEGAVSSSLPTPSAAGPVTGLREADLAAHTQAGQLHGRFMSDAGFPGIPRVGTPGVPGGTSNFSYFHMPIGGLSGAQTPLAAVASGTPFSPAWHMERPHSPLRGQELHPAEHPRRLDHNDPSTRPSTATTLLTTAEGFAHHMPDDAKGYAPAQKVTDDPLDDMPSSALPAHVQASQPSDMQVVARVKYSGDIRMTLTAEILLDYPMPSFVGIPLKLSITGMSFDGVAIVAYIRKRMHFCFLDPEDAETLVGDHVTRDESSQDAATRNKLSKANADLGLLKEIQIESEIGRQESGKQVLKNVGKVEKFVLEQIRRIFEEEFVFPSFWTFLV
jgi:mitochondrial distribution and morphology protein 12